MTKKTISKVIAMVCVAALCLTAVFTGAVSAAEQNATCTVKGWGYDVGARDGYVTFEVTFASNSDFVAGSFNVSGSNLTFVDCEAATLMDGEQPKVYFNVSNSKVLFAAFTEDADPNFNADGSLTLLLKFAPATRISECVAGTTWNITVSNIDLTNVNEDSYTCADASSTANPAHIHNFNQTPVTAGGATTTKCQYCDAVKTEITDASSVTVDDTLAPAGERAASILFAADGDTVLQALLPKATVDAHGDVYFVYTFVDADGTKTATSQKSADTIKIPGDATDYYAFSCGRNGGVGRMARDIVGNFITVDGSSVAMSEEWRYSIKSYAEYLIANGTDKQKDYAKALWNYGYYTTEQLAAPGAAYADSYTADLELYTGGAKTDFSVANYDLPATSAPETSGGKLVAGAKVTTGFKPKMTLRFDSAPNATVSVKAYSGEAGSTALVYSKDTENVTGTEFVISDIPTKYLTGDIVVEANGKTFTYGFGRYAKARVSKTADDRNVFNWMMQYAYYLGRAFA
ncbi:MAG: hypothetical protein J6T73_07380 [Clostridia bacterium]|nr:hypothetical protein [Clostridia bacterium]